ncbi:MAG: glycosyltransferase [Chloroflexota bacterium]|nr:glycosyltransferase [Chloroflexota bacterium]
MPTDYRGPAVFGFESDLPASRVAMISVHTSPLASLGRADAGGMNVYIRELCCHLAPLGHQIDIFTRRVDTETPDVTELCPGVNVITLTAGPAEPLHKDDLFPLLPEFANQAVLSSLRRGVRYDVVHAHYWLSGWTAHLLRRYWDTPFVTMFHTTAHMKRSSGNSTVESPQRIATERQVIDLSDSLIAANPAERADLLWRQRMRTDKVCTVPPGVDLDLFTPGDRDAARRRLGLPGDRPLVLFVGRIDPIKGIDTLVRALADWPAGGLRPRLVLIGGDLDPGGSPTGDLAAVARQADTAGIGGDVLYLGSRPQSDLPDFYRAVDVVAVPSLYESFGLVAVEAMACGRPVVASRAGGLAFTIEDGESGLLVPAADPAALATALHSVVNDVTLADRLGKAAREAAYPFSWEAVASGISHILNRLALGHRADLCCDEEIFA